jgi:hypothetical protein
MGKKDDQGCYAGFYQFDYYTVNDLWQVISSSSLVRSLS